MKLEKSHIKYILLLIGLSLLVFLLIKKIPKIIIFTSMTLVTGLIVFLNYLFTIPVDFSPVFFLSIVITSTLGLGYMILFVILSGFIPAIFTREIKSSTFVYLVVNILVNLISIPLNLGLVVEGVLLSFLYCFLIIVVTGTIKSNFTEQVFANLVSFGINVIYFWKLGETLFSILQ